MHALVHCNVVTCVWENTFWAMLIRDLDHLPFDSFLLGIFSSLAKDKFKVFCVVLWNLWWEQNKITHGSSLRAAEALLEESGRYLFDFQEAK
ncbi:hypothetical protein PanWU01x14_071310 [Parasponia andersonii]|uniref:Uncharacterized protein n=1 Tax=Parasponia andersonii TaxID=3476 RepID=A0A2P5DED9_PARAD|nr:hypothetical protein PanWU01x14_071310 [Parasponia andersonii]